MERIYLDTSVLLSYIQHWIEQNDAVPKVISSQDWELHTGKTASGEFDERREARNKIYTGLLTLNTQFDPADEESPPLESADLNELPHIDFPPPTRNDHEHLKNLTERFANLSAGDTVTLGEYDIDYEGPIDNAFILREYVAEARSRERGLKEKLNVCDRGFNRELQEELDEEINNTQDSKVIAEAVEWRYEYSDNQPNKVVTLDKYDMCNKNEEINQIIVEIESVHATLDIQLPKELLS